MGLPVTVYRYTDAGAPQLVNANTSEWINILKKVLVEGYGTKAPLGWTLEFENAAAFKVAFRNTTTDGGSGGYFQFSGANSNNATCLMWASAGMSNLDAFIKEVPYRALINQATHRGWEIIGTSRGFYLILHQTNKMTMSDGTNTSSYSYYQMYFIGDVESFYANDQSTFTLISGTGGGNTTGNLGVNNNIKYARFYDADGGNGTVTEYTANDPFTGNNNISSYNQNAETLGIQHILSPLLLTIPYNTTDRNGDVAASSNIKPMVRAKIPGMHSSCFMGYRDENWPIDLPMNGVMHTLLRSNYAPHLWINTEQWYD